MIRNVLAERYASQEMTAIWDPVEKIKLERRLWLAVLNAQRQHGLDVSFEVVEAYEAVLDHVDVESIARREEETRHDVKARIEEFNGLAGHQAIHLGMTSRDLTENVEQTQVLRSLGLVTVRAVAALTRLAVLAAESSGLAITGRTHNVPAQVTTVGKRLASAGEELAAAIEGLESLAESYPLRGIKGPVGTQMDQAQLLGDEGAVALDHDIAKALGFAGVMGSVGQVYPRSADFQVISALVALAAAPSSLTTTLRLMAGHDLATEGFRKGQVGSSAMPHKMNARTSERIHGFKVILTGHLAMASGLAGEQWNEGDVSCSVVRRVMLPDAFFAIDGLFASFLTVLDELDFYPAVIEQELADNLPFLATTRLLVAAVAAGTGREEAHQAIKAHCVAAALERRGGDLRSDPLERLADDPDFPLGRAEIEAAVGEPLSFVGLAPRQVAAFVERAAVIAQRHPAASGYRPQPIL